MRLNNDNQEYDSLAYRTYFGGKNSDTYYFNYDIYPLINKFSFIDFLYTANDIEHGGFLVITNKQYIIGYTDGFGVGTHRATYARVMKEILGGGKINSKNEMKELSANCLKNFITARITYEYKGMKETGMPTYSGAIFFRLPEGDTITQEQYDMFKQFYDDYNQELKIIIKKYGIKKFNIQYGKLDPFGTKIVRTINDLEELYEYLGSRIDNNKTLNIDNENILDTKIKQKIKKLN